MVPALGAKILGVSTHRMLDAVLRINQKLVALTFPPLECVFPEALNHASSRYSFEFQSGFCQYDLTNGEFIFETVSENNAFFKSNSFENDTLTSLPK